MPFVIAAVIAALLVGILWVHSTVSNHMKASSSASRALLFREELECPAGSVAVARAWSKAGWMRFCATYNGPWLAAQNGRLEVRGAYFDGQKCGVWERFGADGSVEDRSEYAPCPDSIRRANGVPIGDGAEGAPGGDDSQGQTEARGHNAGR